MNKKLDNHHSPIDHSPDSELGIIQTKGCLYSFEYRSWRQDFRSEHNQIAKGFKFDVLISYCASEDGKIIERIYIFPKEEMTERKGVSIYKFDKFGKLYENGWYEQYRVKDGKILKKVNEIYKNIMKDNHIR